MNNQSNVVHVSAHTRDGYKVSSYTRSKQRSGGVGSLNLSETLSTSFAELADVLGVKEALMDLGYYKPDSKLGLHEYTDNMLFDGIKNFQKDNGLYVDGRMKPGGETETMMNRKLARKLTDRENAALNPNWGDETAKELDRYMESYSQPTGRTRSGIKAAYNDMQRNEKEMRKLGLIGNDKFFHCKGNYEAASRGLLGKYVGKTMSFVNELLDVPRYGIEDSLNDWEANRRGWNGASKRKKLLESCPRDPKKYIK